jgi:hypothetical protein
VLGERERYRFGMVTYITRRQNYNSQHLIMIIMRGMRGKIGPKLAFTTSPISSKDVCLVKERDKDLEWLHI